MHKEGQVGEHGADKPLTHGRKELFPSELGSQMRNQDAVVRQKSEEARRHPHMCGKETGSSQQNQMGAVEIGGFRFPVLPSQEEPRDGEVAGDLGTGECGRILELT